MAFSAMEQSPNHNTQRSHQEQYHPTNEAPAEWPKPIGQLLDELDLPRKMLSGDSFLAKQHQERKLKAQQAREQTLSQVDQSLQKLDEQLKSGRSEALTQFLSTMAKFHKYSFSNQLLIQLQRPDATRVAGFNAWKKFGRFVKKGEKGIRILAPMIGKTKKNAEEPESSKPDDQNKKVYGFRVASVFDVSQTDGKSLPDISSIDGAPGEFLPKLRSLIQDKGIELTYENLAGPEGISKGGAIVIDSTLDPANEFSALVHELAHESMHRGERRSQTTKTQRETEAEAVAFVVSQAIGVETTAKTTDYIQLYRGDSKLLAKSLEFIRSTSLHLITSLNENSNTNEKASTN